MTASHFFYDGIVLHCVYAPIFFIHSSVDEHQGWSQILVILYNVSWSWECKYLFDMLISFLFFNCILGFGVQVKNMQDCCIGTHVALWFAAFLPFTYIWHFSPCYPSLTSPPSPHCPSLAPRNRPQCVMLPSLCPCVLIVQHQPMNENMWCLIFCSCVSLLRMMVARFIHVPTKDTNSSFLMAA